MLEKEGTCFVATDRIRTGGHGPNLDLNCLIVKEFGAAVLLGDPF